LGIIGGQTGRSPAFSQVCSSFHASQPVENTSKYPAVKSADYFRLPAHTHCMGLSSDILPGGCTCADPVAGSVVSHVHAQFVKDVSGSKCRRIAGPVPTVDPRLTTHSSRSTTHDSRSTINCSPIHFFTFSLLHSYTSSLTHLFPRSLVPRLSLPCLSGP